jgi:cellulose synthase/poly-beta-1,6-N-acetylglucosamine synthase-like glycosyltransferase
MVVTSELATDTRQTMSGPPARIVQDIRVAVLVPCYNEAVTIAPVVRDFSRYLPYANIYIYDNNSSDNTAEIAAAAGAIVRCESLQGKGNVVRRMFADIDADVYVLVDGTTPTMQPVRRAWLRICCGIHWIW